MPPSLRICFLHGLILTMGLRVEISFSSFDGCHEGKVGQRTRIGAECGLDKGSG